jgi:hypothetical protein
MAMLHRSRHLSSLHAGLNLMKLSAFVTYGPGGYVFLACTIKVFDHKFRA